MLPKTLALVEADDEFREYLCQYLKERQVQASAFRSAEDLLALPGCNGFEFYVVDLTLPGIDGLQLLQQLRQRSHVGMVAISGPSEPDAFEKSMNAGADMYLAKPVRFEQVLIAVRAVQRRASPAAKAAPGWRLDRRVKLLIAPDNTRIELSEADVAMLDCFVDAGGAPVVRSVLRRTLGYPDTEESDNKLAATVYRLRRRIEKATQEVVPLQSQSRVGYVFKARLEAI